MRKKTLPWLLVVTLILTFIAGCSSTPSARPDGDKAAAKPQKPLIIALGADTRTLVPMKIVDATSTQQLANIYDDLLTRDPKTYEILPNLAESWRNVDELTWEFKLRKGIKFHNGEDFTSESVKLTLDQITGATGKYESHYKSRYAMVQEVQTPDPYTVVIKTKYPTSMILVRLTDFKPMPPSILKAKGPDALQETPIGTGAYKFVKWVKDEQLVLEANPDYWKGKPTIAQVIFKPIPEFSTRLAALLAGEVDIIQNVPVNSMSQVSGSGNARIISIPSSRINFISLNMQKKDSPFKDIRVRQAFNYAVDVDQVMKYVLNGNATRMAGSLSDLNPDVNKNLKPYTFDLPKAKQLLAEAGVDPTKMVLTFDSPQGRYPMDKEWVEAISSQLTKNLGVKINITFNEWGTHLDKMAKHIAGDMFVNGWGPALDVEGTISDLFIHDRTYTAFDVPTTEQMVKDAMPIVDPAKHKAAWDKVQEEVQKQAGWIFLWQQHDVYGVSNRVEFSPRADERIEPFEMKFKN